MEEGQEDARLTLLKLQAVESMPALAALTVYALMWLVVHMPWVGVLAFVCVAFVIYQCLAKPHNDTL